MKTQTATKPATKSPGKSAAKPAVKPVAKPATRTEEKRSATTLPPAADQFILSPHYRVEGASLHFDKSVTSDEWRQACMEVGRFDRIKPFLLGDSVLFGEGAGFVNVGAYEVIEKLTGLSHQTIKNAVTLSRRVLRAVRRPELSPRHHSAVAKFPRDKQQDLLEQAVKNHWTSTVLREKARGKASKQVKQQESPEIAGTRILRKFAKDYRSVEAFSGVIAEIDRLSSPAKQTASSKRNQGNNSAAEPAVVH